MSKNKNDGIESEKMVLSNLKHSGAVAANCKLSVKIGIDILEKGGSAADAAIATLLIDGICNPQSMGLGGGFLCTYYHHNSNNVQCLNAREYAPIKARSDMWGNSSKIPKIGGLSVCVPGEIQGYWDLHQKYGKLSWKDVLQPAIEYCKNGIPITEYCGSFIDSMKSKILQSPSLKEMFSKNAASDLVGYGDFMFRPHMAKTLEIVAEEGPKALYNGELTDRFVQDIQNEGGVITFEDMATYRTAWVDPIASELPDNLTVYSAPQPGSGAVLQLILNVVFGMKEKSNDPAIKWSRLVETWKHAFGFRCRLEGPTKETVTNCIKRMDADCVETIREKVLNIERTSRELEFYNDVCFSSYIGGGTCSVCVLAQNGDAVSITSSINSAYGAMFASPSTGIILNNHMMDFNVERSRLETNEVEPEKQPLSSMSPTIILNNNSGLIRLVIGAAGGPKIITAISQVILDNILYNLPLEQAMDFPRLHHQLMPMKLYYEEGFPHIDHLKTFGHDVSEIKTVRVHDLFIPSSSSASAIEYYQQQVKAFGDKRRDGFGALTSKL